MEDQTVFRALADPSRRRLLDLLFARDGRTLTELESQLPMTRFGVMKHLRVLEEAGLITTRKVGRERLHYLNPLSRNDPVTPTGPSRSNVTERHDVNTYVFARIV